ncbi:MAG: tetratricopeptide repeat protein [Planctomycetota bacterium JB042]
MEEVWSAWGRQEWDSARALAEELVAESPDDAHARATLGYVLDAFGEVDAAAPHLAAAAGSDEVEALRLVALVHGTRYSNLVFSDRSYDAPVELDAATAAYRRWAALEPASAYPLQGLAWLRSSGGKPKEAVGLLTVAVATDPLADEPHGDLWRYLNTEISYDELASFYEGLALVAASDAARGRCLQYQGQLHRFQGDKHRADAAAAETATDRISRLTDAISSYRRAQPLFDLATAADPALSETSLQHEFACRTGVVDASADMGDSAATKKRLTETREALVEKTEVGSPVFVNTVDALSFALFRLAGGEEARFVDAEKYAADMDEIRALWKWACSLVDDRAEWWNNLGFFAREAGEFEESYAAYERCIEFAPDSVRYVNDTGLIQLYHLKDDLPRAEELFRRAVEMGEEQYPAVKDDPALEWEMRSAWGDAMLNLGLVLTEFGRYDEAEAALAKLDALDGGRADLAQAKTALDLRRGDVDGLKQTVHDLLSAEAIDRDTRFLLVSIGRTLKDALEDAPDDELAALLAEIERALSNDRPPSDESGR